MVRTLLLAGFYLIMVNAKAQTFSSGAVNEPIPDDYTIHLSSISVSGAASSASTSSGLKEVCINIDHPAVIDLDVYLITPYGLQIKLNSRPTKGGSNYTNTCFEMSASQSIIQGIAPYSGSFRPLGDFGAANNGQNSNGTWKLAVHDKWSQNGKSGTLKSWSITFGNNAPRPLQLETHLPIISISTGGQEIKDEPKITAEMKIIHAGNGQNSLNDPVISHQGPIGIEYRGSSSQQFPKKSYGFKTLDALGNKLNTSLLSLPTEHDWILDASYTDKTLMRNFITYNMYNDMGHYAARQIYVELVVDNQYQGIYVLTEKLKRDNDRVDIAKMDQTSTSGDALSGGYMIKIDRVKNNEAGWHSNYASNSTGDKIYFQYLEPDEDAILQEQKDYIKGVISDFEDALQSSNFKDPQNGYRKYIELSSFVDNLIINEISRNADAYRLSTWLYKDRNSENELIHYGPVWDYDIAYYNADFGGGNDVSGWQYEYGWNWQPGSGETFPVPFWWRRFMEDPYFQDYLNCRYFNFRNSVLDTQKINKNIDNVAAYLGSALSRNFHQWPVIGMYTWPNPTPVPGTYEGELARMQNWIVDRVAWLDNNMPGKCDNVDVPSKVSLDQYLKCYPNPFTEEVYIHINTQRDQLVEIDLYNILGEHIALLERKNYTAGFHKERILIKNLPPGLYVVTAMFDNKRITHKIVRK